MCCRSVQCKSGVDDREPSVVDLGLIGPCFFRVVFEESFVPQFPDEEGCFGYEYSVQSAGALNQFVLPILEFCQATS